MANTKTVANGYTTDVWFGLPNYAANPANPTAAELNACVRLTQSISWANFGFGLKASTQNSDPSLVDVGDFKIRGFAQYGGAMSFFFPGSYVNDATNLNYVTFATLRSPRTAGYIIIRSDGQKPTVGQAAVAGDFVNIYKVMTDGWNDAVVGESSFKYAITFLNQGLVYVDAPVGVITVATPAPVGTTAYTAAGNGKTPLSSYITGRQMYSNASVFSGTPGRFAWSSSTPATGTVDSNGVFTALAAGTTNVIATDKITGVASTALAITVT